MKTDLNVEISEWKAVTPVFTFGGKINNSYSEVVIKKEFDFNDKEWVNRADRQEEINSIIKMDPLLNNQSSRKKIDPQLLPMILLINDILNRKRKVSIVDFGGGMGEHYRMTYWYPKNARDLINYSVIEVPHNCIEGKKINFLGRGVRFVSNEINSKGECTYDRSEIENKCDIVMLCGTLQYFKSWKSILKNLAEHKPKYIYLTRTLITDSPTFYVCQSMNLISISGKNKYMGDCVCIVYNLQELIIVMKNLKYDLALDLLLAPYNLEPKDYSGNYGKTEYHSIIFKNVE